MKQENQDENKNIYQETENVLQKMQEQLKLSEDALKKPQYRRSMTLLNNPKINLNQNIVKIKDSSLEFVNIEDDFKKKPKDSPFDDICSICSSNIFTEKYLCLICKECILCQNCELNHLHPVIKWKNNQLSNLNKIYLFMSNNDKEVIENNKKNKGKFFGSSRQKYNFKLKSDTLEYSMKPNQEIDIPITICNLNSHEVDCEKLKIVLFGRNIKDLIVYNKDIKDKIKKDGNFKTFLSIESGNFCKNYQFEVALFSSADIDLDFNIISFKIKVSK